MVHPHVPAWRQAVHRRIRQARYRRKPAVRKRRRDQDRDRYWRNPEAKILEVRRYQKFGPTPDPSLTREFRLESGGPSGWNLLIDPRREGNYALALSGPEISTFLSYGKDNPRLRRFLTIELMRRYPHRYPDRRSIPAAESVRGRPGGYHVREVEIRIRNTELEARTEAVLCPNCQHFGAMRLWEGGRPTVPIGHEPVTCPACQVGFGILPELLHNPSRCPLCGSTAKPIPGDMHQDLFCPDCGGVLTEFMVDSGPVGPKRRKP
jgi:hypothetical protein